MAVFSGRWVLESNQYIDWCVNFGIRSRLSGKGRVIALAFLRSLVAWCRLVSLASQLMLWFVFWSSHMLTSPLIFFTLLNFWNQLSDPKKVAAACARSMSLMLAWSTQMAIALRRSWPLARSSLIHRGVAHSRPVWTRTCRRLFSRAVAFTRLSWLQRYLWSDITQNSDMAPKLNVIASQKLLPFLCQLRTICDSCPIFRSAFNPFTHAVAATFNEDLVDSWGTGFAVNVGAVDNWHKWEIPNVNQDEV